jgi:hypothetical protein
MHHRGSTKVVPEEWDRKDMTERIDSAMRALERE